MSWLHKNRFNDKDIERILEDDKELVHALVEEESHDEFLMKSLEFRMQSAEHFKCSLEQIQKFIEEAERSEYPWKTLREKFPTIHDTLLRLKHAVRKYRRDPNFKSCSRDWIKLERMLHQAIDHWTTYCQGKDESF